MRWRGWLENDEHRPADIWRSVSQRVTLTTHGHDRPYPMSSGGARLGTMQIAYIAAVRYDLGLVKRSAG